MLFKHAISLIDKTFMPTINDFRHSGEAYVHGIKHGYDSSQDFRRDFLLRKRQKSASDKNNNNQFPIVCLWRWRRLSDMTGQINKQILIELNCTTALKRGALLK